MLNKGLPALAVLGMSSLWLAACGGGGSSPTYTVGVAVSGLQSGKTLVLLNNGSDNLPVSADGTIDFSIALSNGASYSVMVATQPVGQACTVLLSEIAGSPFLLTSLGTSESPWGLGEFAINATTGLLSIVGQFGVPGTVAVTSVDPSNTYVFPTYAPYQNLYGKIGPLAINHSTGLLTQFKNGSTLTDYADPIAFSNTP